MGNQRQKFPLMSYAWPSVFPLASRGFSFLPFLSALEVKKVLFVDEQFFCSSSVKRNRKMTKLTKLDFYSIENSRIITGRVCNFKKRSLKKIWNRCGWTYFIIEWISCLGHVLHSGKREDMRPTSSFGVLWKEVLSLEIATTQALSLVFFFYSCPYTK